jgi:hypothetical protein
MLCPSAPCFDCALFTRGFIPLQVEALGLKPGESYHYMFAVNAITCVRWRHPAQLLALPLAGAAC